MACSLEAVSIGKLESLLQCSICLETVKDPRTLPCFHSYCKACLERFVKNHRDKVVRLDGSRQTENFNCPNCRDQFSLNSDEKVADMTPNHFICNMLEVMAVKDRVKGVPCSHCQGPSVGRCVTCEVFLCQECLTDHNKYRGFTSHSVLSMDELSKPENQVKIRGKLYCTEHKEKTLKFYCETCSELICRYCMDFKHTRQNHLCLLVKEVAKSQKSLLSSSCNTLEEQLIEGSELLETIADVTGSLDRAAENAKSEIIQQKQDMINAFSKIIDEKAQCLLDDVINIHSEKRSELEAQTDEVRLYVDKVKRSVQLAKSLLEKGNDEEILSSQKMIQDNAENFKKERSRNTKPVNNGDLDYISGKVDEKKFAAMADNFGSVHGGEEIDGISEVSEDSNDCTSGKEEGEENSVSYEYAEQTELDDYNDCTTMATGNDVEMEKDTDGYDEQTNVEEIDDYNDCTTMATGNDVEMEKDTGGYDEQTNVKEIEFEDDYKDCTTMATGNDVEMEKNTDGYAEQTNVEEIEDNSFRYPKNDSLQEYIRESNNATYYPRKEDNSFNYTKKDIPQEIHCEKVRAPQYSHKAKEDNFFNYTKKDIPQEIQCEKVRAPQYSHKAKDNSFNYTKKDIPQEIQCEKVRAPQYSHKAKGEEKEIKSQRPYRR